MEQIKGIRHAFVLNIRVTEDAANDLNNIKAYIGREEGVVVERVLDPAA